MADLDGLQLVEAKITGIWPLKSQAKAWTEAAKWAAFREADPEKIRPRDWDVTRPYIVDPLAGRISETWADLIHGEEPNIEPANEADADRLLEVIEGNDYSSGLQGAEDICSSEGSTWWRILCDPETADHPLIEWHSRMMVIPIFRGKALRAVAFWSELPKDPNTEETYRVFEIHADGVVRNLLFRGSRSSVGTKVNLTDHPDTADIPEDDWMHGLPMLAGKILNRTGPKRTEGASDYKRVEGLLYALNEAVTIGSENARLTLKQRVAVPSKYLDPVTQKFPAGAEVLISQSVDQNPDTPDSDRMAQIEWSFDADAWTAWHDKLTDLILTRTRVAPQLMGRSAGNSPESGTALRSRILDSVMAANGKARAWDTEIPRQLSLVARVDAMPVEQGGFGATWTDAESPPTFERASTLPEDAGEETERVVLEVSAEILSRRSAIEERHPDWTDERVKEELKRIADEREAAMPETFTSFGTDDHDHSGGAVEEPADA